MQKIKVVRRLEATIRGVVERTNCLADLMDAVPKEQREHYDAMINQYAAQNAGGEWAIRGVISEYAGCGLINKIANNLLGKNVRGVKGNPRAPLPSLDEGTVLTCGRYGANVTLGYKDQTNSFEVDGALFYQGVPILFEHTIQKRHAKLAQNNAWRRRELRMIMRSATGKRPKFAYVYFSDRKEFKYDSGFFIIHLPLREEIATLSWDYVEKKKTP